MEIGSLTFARAAAATPVGSRKEESVLEVPDLKATPQPPLSNPSFRYDITARVAILTYYDESGEVKSQIPAEQVVELYRQNGLRQAAGVEPTLLTPFEAIRLGIPPGSRDGQSEIPYGSKAIQPSIGEVTAPGSAGGVPAPVSTPSPSAPPSPPAVTTVGAGNAGSGGGGGKVSISV